MELQKKLASKVKIRFNDCDPFNHLNNSKYIDYIVTVRSDQLIEYYGLDTFQLALEEAVGWVSAQTNISYLIPAFPNEEVLVETRLMGFTGKSLHVEGIMWNSNQTIVKAVMWVKLVHFNLITQKSHQHSKELINLFEKIVHPLSEEFTFEERVINLKSKI
jgi:acyl-CoA thioesterase FadM